jgi:hypothetical protein
MSKLPHPALRATLPIKGREKKIHPIAALRRARLSGDQTSLER